MDFVIVAKQPWENEVGHNTKNIAIELAKNHRVLYVNPALGRKNYHFNKKHFVQLHKENCRNGDYLDRISDSLSVFYPSFIAESINWIPVNGVFDALNRWNNNRLASRLKPVIKELNFDSFILFNDSVMFQGLHLPELIEPKLSIYYIRDNLVTQPYWRRHGTRIEPILAEKYDMVVSNSDYLGDYLRAYNPDTYMVGQGCDLSLFNPTESPRPKELKGIDGRIIGYTGFLTTMRLDVELLERSAAANPEFSFVLVGPEDEGFKRSSLHRLSNVHFLGNFPMERLPEFINHFDVAINPQLVNGMTIGNYPRKIDEYLAMGKPVVARATRAMDYFKDYVYLYSKEDEFMQCIEKAIAEDNDDLKSERMDFASQHTWEENVANMVDVIRRQLEKAEVEVS